MKTCSIASQAALALVRVDAVRLSPNCNGLICTQILAVGDASPIHSKRADNAISSCYGTWMPKNDVKIGQGAETRPGFDSAVDSFCDAAAEAGKVLGSGDTFLSYVTAVELSFGKDPKLYGQLGFVECMDFGLCLRTLGIMADVCVGQLRFTIAKMSRRQSMVSL